MLNIDYNFGFHHLENQKKNVCATFEGKSDNWFRDVPERFTNVRK